MGTQDDAATTGHVPAGIGGDAYGYGTATGAVVEIDDRGQLEPTWRHRVTRYASRADTVGTQVGPIGAITMFEDPVAPGIYRYVVEYVEYVNDEWVVRHHALDVIVKVEGSALSAPENLSTTYSEHNGQTRMSWDPPASTHPANMAIYETRRRNAKDVHDAYQTLGFSTNDEFVDHTVLSGQHYEYEVRAVGWDQSKGEYSASAVAPPFPAPECIDDTNSTVPLGVVDMGRFTSPPKNVRNGFQASFRQSEDSPATCTPDLTDFFVERRVLYQHAGRYRVRRHDLRPGGSHI